MASPNVGNEIFHLLFLFCQLSVDRGESFDQNKGFQNEPEFVSTNYEALHGNNAAIIIEPTSRDWSSAENAKKYTHST